METKRLTSYYARAVSPAPITSAAKLTVRELPDAPEQDDAGWTEFVTRNPAANLYHTLLWRELIAEVFGHRPVYLLAERGGSVCGVAPMFLVKAPMFGSKLISLPYDIGSGGALAADDAAECALAKHAISLARELRVNYLELRCGSERAALASSGLHRSEPVLITELELDSEEAVRARVKKDHRGAIQIAERRRVTVREAESLEDYLAFYQIYLRVFRAFGAPPYGAVYFSSVWRRLRPSGAARLLLAHAGSRCVGGLLLFCWGQNLIDKFALCLPEARPLRANAMLYWRAIQLGLELGYRKLNMGTSSRDQTGLIEFKERWGAQTRPAVFYDLPVRGRVPAIERYYSSAGLARRVWRQLPLWATRAGGGALNRWFC